MGAVGINFGAATSGSGFDVTSTVNSIIANIQQVEDPWNTNLTTLKADDTALTSIGTDLATLSSSLESLTSFTGVMAEKEGSSSNPDVLTLSSASATASAGTHSVVVSQLAQTASAYSSSIASTDTIRGALTIQVGSGTATTIPVVSGSTDTLSTYAASINAAGIGVHASIITDTTGSRLSLVSATSGAAGALTITQGGTIPSSSTSLTATSVVPSSSNPATSTFTLPNSASLLSGTLSYAIGSGSAATVDLGSTPLSLADAASALNSDSGFTAAGLTASIDGASLVITGATDPTGSDTIDTSLSSLTATTPAATYSGLSDVTSPSSTLKISNGLTAQDAQLTVDGVAIDSSSNTLSTAIPGVTFQILAASTEPVQVEITNDTADIESAFQSFVSAYNTVAGDLTTQEGNTSSGTPEPLYGNPIISQLQSALSVALTSGAASGSINSLYQLGISVTSTGTLSLNTSSLESALNSNFSDVVGFMQNTGSFGQTLSSVLSGLGNSTPNGAITLELSADQSQETTYNADLTQENTLIAAQKTSLTTELNAANQTLQAIPEQLNEINELYSAMTGYNTGTSG